MTSAPGGAYRGIASGRLRVIVADDMLAGGVIGLTRSEMRQYLEYVADQRFAMLGLPQLERRVSA
jgi:hypothetical protein